MSVPNHMAPPRRVITTHNKEGQAVINDSISDQPEGEQVMDGEATFFLSYCTDQFPVEMNNDQDLAAYKKYSLEPPGLVVSGGTVLRHVDFGPGIVSPMHRTVSLDYGIVIEGEIELSLDSGETRLLRPGDIAIQRGTMHAWRNTSDTKWARMLYVLQESKPLTVAGEKLGEDYQDMKGVRAST